MAKVKEKETGDIKVVPIRTGSLLCSVMGIQPLIYNAMAEKAKHELLLPRGGRKTAADRAASLKHEPLEEYRNSVYRWRDDRHATRLCFPSAAFRRAMGAAALDTPGLKKAQIERLIWIDQASIDVYGVPQLLMSVVRCQDMNHTPDIRTRAILPEWGCSFTLHFVETIIKPGQLMNLLANAGVLTGIGDWRQQKGSGSFGQFVPKPTSDPAFKTLMKNGRAAQDAALTTPSFYDDESQKLFTWFLEEVGTRGLRMQPSDKTEREEVGRRGRRRGNDGAGAEA